MVNKNDSILGNLVKQTPILPSIDPRTIIKTRDEWQSIRDDLDLDESQEKPLRVIHVLSYSQIQNAISSETKGEAIV
jgi:hypothetical protein